jgi:hypothetical protein
MEGSKVAVTALVAITVAVLGFIIYQLYEYYQSGRSGSGPAPEYQTSVPIITAWTNKNGRTASSFSNSKLPRSNNQPGGAEFSYAFWLRVHSWSNPTRTPPAGEQFVFVKGTPGSTIQSPAFTIGGAAPNAVHITQDTYSRENSVVKVSIDNVATNMFYHFAVVVSDTKLEIYVNGQLKEYRRLDNVPRQNTSDLRIAPNGGFDGDIGTLTYYNYALTASEVSAIANVPPTQGPDSVVLPPYQAERWWY